MQNQRCSLVAVSLSPLTLFPMSVEIPKCSHILTLKLRLVKMTYYGKTKHHFKVGIREHLGIFALTEKRVKGDDDSAIKEHL